MYFYFVVKVRKMVLRLHMISFVGGRKAVIMNSLLNVLKSHNKMMESASEVHNIKNLSVKESVIKCVGKL